MDDSDAIHVNFWPELWHPDDFDIQKAKSLGEICPACKNLRISTILVHSELILQYEKGCLTCAIIVAGLIQYENEIERVKNNTSEHSILYEMEVRDGLPLRITTQTIFDTAEEALDPPVYEYFSLPGKQSPIPNIGPSLDLSKTPVSARWLEPATAWIRDCIANHPQCRGLGATPMPSRVLYIGDSPRLYDSIGTEGIYICLSYCWGKSRNLVTTRSNIESMKQGITWSTLPKTFRDAIRIARLLHVTYLWVDSLCIIQDDDEDWERESSCMAKIYENAFLTISATDAKDADGGCFMDKDPRAREVHQIYPTKDQEPLGDDCDDYSPILVRRAPNHTLFGMHYSHDYSLAPLLGRAWALQEHVLSIRVLQFTASEVRWECKGTLACECMGIISQGEQTKQLHFNIQEKNDAKELSSLWGSIIQRYTSLGLTKQTDRLPALSGIAKQFLKLGTLGSYHAGLWENDFIRGLSWFIPHFRTSRRPEKYRAPTWSWASIEGVTFTSLHLEHSGPEFLTVEMIETTPTGLDPTGQIAAGFCMILGAVIKRTLSYETTEEGRITYYLDKEHGISFSPDVRIDLSDSPDFLENGSEVTCLRIGCEPNIQHLGCFLVLRVARELVEHAGIVARVGIVKIQNHGSIWSHCARLERVLIV